MVFQEENESAGRPGDGDDEMSVYSTSVEGGQALAHSAEKKQPEEIAARESQWVFCLRSATFFFLVLATVGVALVTYFYVRWEEEEQMEEKFHDNAHKVQQAIGTLLENTLKAVDSFSTSMVTHAATVRDVSPYNNDNNSSTGWPYVTLPSFAVHGSKLRSLSKVFLFSVYHHVTHEQRATWENYTSMHNGWVDAGIESQKNDPSFKGLIVEEWQTLGQINFNGQPAPDAPFYMARWQTSPVVVCTQVFGVIVHVDAYIFQTLAINSQSFVLHCCLQPFWDPYNWDAYQLPLIRNAMKIVLDTHKVVISETYNMGEEDKVDLTAFVGDSDTAFEPAMELYTPVIDDTSGDVSLVNKTSNEVVSILALSIHWRSLIEDILPEGNDGMVVVFQSACNQTFTYEIDGPQVAYLGEGDRSDPDYHSMSQTSSFGELTRELNEDGSYTGPLLSEDLCPYRITLYPSKVMAEDYLSSDPIIYAIGAVAIFVFTSLVFLAYDCMIEHRQRVVMRSAKQSSAIVDSLFPSNVKKRLYEQETEEQDQDISTSERSENILRDFMQGDEELTNQKTKQSSKPIADQFDDTTVLFADIKGFTKWSSTRQPSQVFVLLESLYGAFDKVAEKRGVYKIETIGDVSCTYDTVHGSWFLVDLFVMLTPHFHFLTNTELRRCLWSPGTSQESCPRHGQVCGRYSQQNQQAGARTTRCSR